MLLLTELKSYFKSQSVLFFFLTIILCGSVCALADTDPNQTLNFKKIYIAPSEDNVEGVYRETIEQAYRAVFEKNPRFELVGSEASADSIVKTKVEKRSTSTEIEMGLYLNPNGEKFTEQKMSISSAAASDEITTAAKKGLKNLLKKIPFYGSVTGREGDKITIDIGSGNGLHEGDLVQFSKIENIKRHPLLKTVLDVQMEYVGTAQIDVVENSIAFATVKNEASDTKISRLHKVTGVESPPETSTKTSNEQSDEFPESGFIASRDKVVASRSDRPEIGFIGIGPFLGMFSASSSVSNGAINVSGSGFSPGLKVSSELWLTKSWFVDLDFGYSFASFAMNDDRTFAVSNKFSTSAKSFGADIGYRHYVWGTTRGPTVFGKVGYSSFTWTAPTDSSYIMGVRSYAGLRAGIGGSLPIANKGRTNFFMGLDVALDPGFEATGTPVTPDTTQTYSASMVNFKLGVHHDFLPTMALRVGFGLDTYSVEYEGGAAAIGRSNTSQKQYGITPQLLYYF